MGRELPWNLPDRYHAYVQKQFSTSKRTNVKAGNIVGAKSQPGHKRHEEDAEAGRQAEGLELGRTQASGDEELADYSFDEPKTANKRPRRSSKSKMDTSSVSTVIDLTRSRGESDGGHREEGTWGFRVVQQYRERNAKRTSSDAGLSTIQHVAKVTKVASGKTLPAFSSARSSKPSDSDLFAPPASQVLTDDFRFGKDDIDEAEISTASPTPSPPPTSIPKMAEDDARDATADSTHMERAVTPTQILHQESYSLREAMGQFASM